jgi:hypothetical protein
MSSGINDLVRSVLQKKSLNDCSLDELKEIAGKYPYFSAIHFLLAKKSFDKAGTGAIPGKVSLYFPNPLWLGLLLTEKGTARIGKTRLEGREMAKVFEPAFTAERTVAISGSPKLGPTPATTTMLEKEETEREKRVMVEGDVEVTATEKVVTKEEDGEETATEKLVTMEEEIEKPAQVINETELAAEENNTATEETQIDPINTSSMEMENAPSMETEIPAPKAVAMEQATPENPGWRFESVSNTSEISFEPFHTVDYFASQGIKFSEEEKPKDKFGQQLKSFTEWLKLMKKGPATDIATPVVAITDKKVEKLAEHSLEEREVLTEAMAEVWEKQGNRDKALAIYRKLSLLNPSKSSYFAAKIEHLKQS